MFHGEIMSGIGCQKQLDVRPVFALFPFRLAISEWIKTNNKHNKLISMIDLLAQRHKGVDGHSAAGQKTNDDDERMEMEREEWRR